MENNRGFLASDAQRLRRLINAINGPDGQIVKSRFY